MKAKKLQSIMAFTFWSFLGTHLVLQDSSHRALHYLKGLQLNGRFREDKEFNNALN